MMNDFLKFKLVYKYFSYIIIFFKYRYIIEEQPAHTNALNMVCYFFFFIIIFNLSLGFDWFTEDILICKQKPTRTVET